MGRSRRSYKKGKATVRVGLPKKKGGGSKPSMLAQYAAQGFVANPNVLGARDRSAHSVQSVELQSVRMDMDSKFDSDDETDEVKSALNKVRKDGKKAPVKRLTKMQRVYFSRLIQKHGFDYQAMARDIKLNEMQHPEGSLRKYVAQFLAYEKLPAEVKLPAATSVE
ncbi:hypothetical protein R1flu_021758 [Riccia fluitans]|uniref:Nucleolar protein 16 n=1 Tax=Riccia fluitans TaxID=41844 RepID=A0ABD1ZRW8_9MARC